MNERFYWLCFSVFPGIGPKTFEKLHAEFGSAKAAWQAPRSHLARLIAEKILARFEDFRNDFSPEQYADKLQKKDVAFIIVSDKEYPNLLKEIKNPPIVLYVKGSIEILNQFQDDKKRVIAIVGTRKITQYGRDVTKLFTSSLVLAGFTVVSGLAMGVDAVAHSTTIENSGKTIAVLGCGVDCCTPVENQYLYDKILQSGGTILSELPLGHPPSVGSFPARNRIVAGLSEAVLVTEGAADSGSLITADYALKCGRKVFAVPGPITSDLSKGPYKLIEQGSKLVTSPEDILREFKIQNLEFKIANQNAKVKGMTKEEEKILEILAVEPLTFDEIVRKSGLVSSKVGSILSFMEVKGIVKSVESGLFSIAA